MSNDNSLSLSELNDRIAILRDNMRQLVEQAAGSSGAQDEERTSERIAQQQEQLDMLVKQHPIGRLGVPGDVANAVGFLCDPATRFVTGALLAVDGGQLVA